MSHKIVRGEGGDLECESEWKCPKCYSYAVQVCRRAWMLESSQEQVIVDIDVDGRVIAWQCEDCGETGDGQPVRV